MAFAGLMQLLFLLAFGLSIGKCYRYLKSPLSQRRLFLAALAGNALGVVFAAERSAWLGVVAALLFASLLLSFRTSLKTMAGVLALVLVLWCTVPVVQQRLTPLINWQNDVSIRVRFRLWRESVDLFCQKPLFGVGIRNFPHHVIPEALGQGHAAIDHAHSNYMQILATTGAVGFAAYIYLWFSVFTTIFAGLPLATLRSRPESLLQAEDWALERGINLGVLAGVVSLMVSGIFEYNFGTSQVRMAQWFLFAMLNGGLGAKVLLSAQPSAGNGEQSLAQAEKPPMLSGA